MSDVSHEASVGGGGWSKNSAGVKDGCECYRTINGVRWDWWSASNVDQLRAAGVRCRRFGADVFIHPGDEEKAWNLTYARPAS